MKRPVVFEAGCIHVCVYRDLDCHKLFELLSQVRF